MKGNQENTHVDNIDQKFEEIQLAGAGDDVLTKIEELADNDPKLLTAVLQKEVDMLEDGKQIVNPDTKRNQNITPILLTVITQGNAALLNKILKIVGQDLALTAALLEQKDSDGLTPLHYAAMKGYREDISDDIRFNAQIILRKKDELTAKIDERRPVVNALRPNHKILSNEKDVTKKRKMAKEFADSTLAIQSLLGLIPRRLRRNLFI